MQVASMPSMDNQFFEIEVIPDHIWQTEQSGILRLVVTRRYNCERIANAIELLHYLSECLHGATDQTRVTEDGYIVPAWLVDHIVIDTYNGNAVAYLRPNT